MKKKFILNNYSIKRKLNIIYAFCVLIPLIITNSIVYISTKKSLYKEQETNFEHVIDRVKYNLEDNIDSCLSISNYLYTDSKLNDLITTQYSSNIDFYEKYNSMLQSNVIKYYFSSQKVYKVNIYVDNDTIVNSADFYKLNEKIKEKKWYKQFEDNHEKTTITVDYNDENTLYNHKKNARVISIVRKLDYYKDGINKIIKIDMDYNAILDKILNEQMNDNLYVCNNNKILFYNKDTNYPDYDFESKENINKNDFMVEEELKFKGIKDPWNIIISADRANLIDSDNINYILIILIVFNLILPTIIITAISKSLVVRVSVISKYLDKVEKEEFCEIKCNEGKDEIGKLIKSYNVMVLKIKELIEVVFKKEMEKKNLQLAKNIAELKALQSQVNPHFMFNTLESIRMRSLIKGENETADIIEKLSVLLRITINWGEDYIKIEDEMNFVENYLEIQKYRFGEKVNYEVYIQKECRNIKIPKLSILSFVENSCVHGIERIARNGKVNIKIYIENNYLVISIKDTGCGIQEEKLNSIMKKIDNAENELFTNTKGIGMLNSYMRLKRYSQNSIQFSINSVFNKGTNVLIKIDVNKLDRGDLL